MNTDKRDFANFSNKKSFPGKIDSTTGEYHFPALFHIDSSENTRKWEIKVRLIKGIPKKYGIDWDVLKAMEDSQKVVKCESTIHFTEDEAPMSVSTTSLATDVICDEEDAINVDDI